MNEKIPIDAGHRKKLVDALPTFMNQCEGGACHCTGDDIKDPDEFESASLNAMDSIRTVALARYHHSQKEAIFRALRAEMDMWMRQI